ncbi:MAG TPA: glycosyltransferase [Pyrinomonadaceae bacterium]
MPPELSIFIPAYNESARLGRTLPTVFAYLEGSGLDGEVILDDDGPADGACERAERAIRDAGRAGASLIRNRPDRGEGRAVRTGLLAARAPVALFSDAGLYAHALGLPS